MNRSYFPVRVLFLTFLPGPPRGQPGVLVDDVGGDGDHVTATVPIIRQVL